MKEVADEKKIQDPEDGVAEEPASETKTDELDFLKSHIAELEDRLLRSVAEFQNFQKKSERERTDVASYSISSFAKDILTVRDNMKLALDNCSDESNPIIDGVKLTISEMDKVLSRHGIVPIDAMNNEFDPHLHQALIEKEIADKKPGIVIGVMQDGFMIHNRLLRPALVSVSKSVSSE
jgi:molecular chaperone GrpE